jgi:hypothetical protein
LQRKKAEQEESKNSIRLKAAREGRVVLAQHNKEEIIEERNQIARAILKLESKFLKIATELRAQGEELMLQYQSDFQSEFLLPHKPLDFAIKSEDLEETEEDSQAQVDIAAVIELHRSYLES